MSGELVTRVFWTQMDDPTMKAVLVSLADQAQIDGHCYPSIAYIAHRTGWSERCVQKKIQGLMHLGFLKVRYRRDQSSEYLINLDKLAIQKPEWNSKKEKHIWSEYAHEFRGGDEPEPELFPLEGNLQVTGERGSPHVPEGVNVVRQGVNQIHPRGERGSPRGERGAPITVREIPEEIPEESLCETSFPDNTALVDWFAGRWNELAAKHQSISSIRLPVSDDRRDIIIRRTQSHVKDGRKREFWEEFFHRIENSPFLCGQVKPQPPYTKSFSLKLNWALTPSKLNEIMDGSYDRDNNSAKIHGSAMSAANRVASRLDAHRQRGN